MVSRFLFPTYQIVTNTAILFEWPQSNKYLLNNDSHTSDISNLF